MQAVVALLGILIPWLGGLLNIPVLGWVIRLGVDYLSAFLFDLIDRAVAERLIDQKIQDQVTVARSALTALNEKPEGETPDQRQKKIAEFQEAMRRLRRIDLV